jgi:hypothetical protein
MTTTKSPYSPRRLNRREEFYGNQHKNPATRTGKGAMGENIYYSPRIFAFLPTCSHQASCIVRRNELYGYGPFSFVRKNKQERHENKRFRLLVSLRARENVKIN